MKIINSLVFKFVFEILLTFCGLQIKIKGIRAQHQPRDFVDVRESAAFVDKTLLIKEIFYHKLFMITAPRHFGKSVNSEMISLFLSNHQDTSEIRDVFNGTYIMMDKRFVGDHMNKYPVIFCSFDTGLEVVSEETLLSYYRQILFGIFMEHDYLKDSLVLNDEQRTLFNKYIEGNDDLQKQEVLNGLNFLTQLLYSHNDQEVILIIDEYDAIFVDYIFNTGNLTVSPKWEQVDFGREIMDFHQTFLRRTLKENNYIDRAMITGTLPIDFQHDVTTSSLEFEHIGFMQDTLLIKFYGFTIREVQHLVNTFKLSIEEQQIMLKHYDGYCGPKSKIRVLNPWVVVKFLDLKLNLGYWVQRFPIRDILLPLMDNIKIRENVIRLWNSTERCSITIKEAYTLKDLQQLKKIIFMYSDEEVDTDIVFQFLLQIGYLTYDNPGKKLPKTVALLKIPNKEIEDEFASIIKEYFTKDLKPD